MYPEIPFSTHSSALQNTEHLSSKLTKHPNFLPTLLWMNHSEIPAFRYSNDISDNSIQFYHCSCSHLKALCIVRHRPYSNTEKIPAIIRPPVSKYLAKWEGKTPFNQAGRGAAICRDLWGWGLFFHPSSLTDMRSFIMPKHDKSFKTTLVASSHFNSNFYNQGTSRMEPGPTHCSH